MFGITFAQQASPSPSPTAIPPQPSGPREATVEDVTKLRNEVLDLFGIPHDAQLSIFDLMTGGTSGFKIPDIGIKRPVVGPLQDAQLLLDTKSLRPGTRVRAFVVTFSADPQKSTFTWYHNDARVASGKGITFYDFTLGQMGSAENIRVSVTAGAGASRQLSKTVRPARIHFSWFTDSYTPPWYKGKALASPGSTILISAIPDFRLGTTKLDPKNLIYEWTIDDTATPRDSGLSGNGKNIYPLRTPVIGTQEVKVDLLVKDELERIVHQETIFVQTRPADLVFYDRDALLGTRFERTAANARIKSGSDIALELEPYFLPRGIFDALRFGWRVNNQKLTNTAPLNRVLRLKTDEKSSGRQVISATYENTKNIYQRGGGQTIIEVEP